MQLFAKLKTRKNKGAPQITSEDITRPNQGTKRYQRVRTNTNTATNINTNTTTPIDHDSTIRLAPNHDDIIDEDAGANQTDPLATQYISLLGNKSNLDLDEKKQDIELSRSYSSSLATDHNYDESEQDISNSSSLTTTRATSSSFSTKNDNIHIAPLSSSRSSRRLLDNRSQTMKRSLSMTDINSNNKVPKVNHDDRYDDDYGWNHNIENNNSDEYRWNNYKTGKKRQKNRSKEKHKQKQKHSDTRDKSGKIRIASLKKYGNHNKNNNSNSIRHHNSRRTRENGKIPLPMRSDSIMTIESSSVNLLRNRFDEIDTGNPNNDSSSLLKRINHDYNNHSPLPLDDNGATGDTDGDFDFGYKFNFDFSTHLPYNEIDDYIGTNTIEKDMNPFNMTHKSNIKSKNNNNNNNNNNHNRQKRNGQRYKYKTYYNRRNGYINRNWNIDNYSNSNTFKFLISIIFDLIGLIIEFVAKFCLDIIPSTIIMIKNILYFIQEAFFFVIGFTKDFLGISNWRDRQSWSKRAKNLYEKVSTQDQYYMIAENYSQHGKQRKLISRRWNADKINDKIGKCVICLTGNKDTALQDCGHVTICNQCSKNLRQCPICRTKIVKKPLQLKF